MRQNVCVFVAILVSVVSNATFAQVRPAVEPRFSAPHPTPTPTCNTGQAPTVRVEVRATYAHLSWQPVPAAVEYHISRTSSGSPNRPPVILPGTNPPTLTEYWDSVPDPRYSYTYSISAIRADRCYGTTQVTVPSTMITLPNPAKAVVVRRAADTGGTLLWTSVFGALAYRIDGPGLSVMATAGTFNEGYVPTDYGLGGISGIFRVKNPDPACPQCNVGMALKDIPNISRYSITAMFPGNFADYQHSLVVSPAIVPPCAITDMFPLAGYVGTYVTIKGVFFTYADQVHFIFDQRGESFQSPSHESDGSLRVSTHDFSPLQGNPPYKGVFGVHTPAGWCMSPFRYEVWAGTGVQQPPPPPPKVSVPDVPNGTALARAQQILAQAGLKAKVVFGPSDPTSLVTSEAPGFGARVNPGSEVDLTTIAGTTITPALGINTLVVINNLESHDDIYLWSFDNSIGQWTQENKGDALNFQGSTSITLTNNHTMQFFAADPKLCPQLNDTAQQSDARNSACVAAFTPQVLGNSNGATTTWAIGQSMAY